MRSSLRSDLLEAIPLDGLAWDPFSLDPCARDPSAFAGSALARPAFARPALDGSALDAREGQRTAGRQAEHRWTRAPHRPRFWRGPVAVIAAVALGAFLVVPAARRSVAAAQLQSLESQWRSAMAVVNDEEWQAVQSARDAAGGATTTELSDLLGPVFSELLTGIDVERHVVDRQRLADASVRRLRAQMTDVLGALSADLRRDRDYWSTGIDQPGRTEPAYMTSATLERRAEVERLLKDQLTRFDLPASVAPTPPLRSLANAAARTFRIADEPTQLLLVAATDRGLIDVDVDNNRVIADGIVAGRLVELLKRPGYLAGRVVAPDGTSRVVAIRPEWRTVVDLGPGGAGDAYPVLWPGRHPDTFVVAGSSVLREYDSHGPVSTPIGADVALPEGAFVVGATTTGIVVTASPEPHSPRQLELLAPDTGQHQRQPIGVGTLLGVCGATVVWSSGDAVHLGDTTTGTERIAVVDSALRPGIGIWGCSPDATHMAGVWLGVVAGANVPTAIPGILDVDTAQVQLLAGPGLSPNASNATTTWSSTGSRILLQAEGTSQLFTFTLDRPRLLRLRLPGYQLLSVVDA